MKLQILLILLLASAVSSSEFQWFPLGNWIEEEGTPDLAGHCVANSMDGNIIAVSAPHYAPEGEEGLRFGRVVVYKFDELTDAWSKLGDEIIGKEGDSFGWSLGMSDDGKSIIVGSLSDHDEKAKAGKAEIFILDDVTGSEKWIRKGQELFGKNAFDEFGYSVGIRDGGGVIAIGSPGEDNIEVIDGDDAGAVRVYKWDSSENTWIEVENVIKGKKQRGRYGQSLALSQVGVIAIGAPGADGSTGMVDMIRYNATSADWTTDGIITLPTAIKEGDMFGYSVSISFDGGTVAIGAPRHRGNDNHGLKDSGVVIVYKYNLGVSTWTQIGDEIIGNRAGDQAGTSVHLSESGVEVAIGSPFSSMNGPESGHIAVYNLVGTVWSKMQLDIDGKKAYNNLGASVALSGDGQQVMGGAPTEGYATVYQLAKTASPTSSPTFSPDVKRTSAPRKKITWFAITFLIVFSGLLVFAAVKILLFVRNKRSLASFQATAADDLEMTPHGVPTDGDTRDVI